MTVQRVQRVAQDYPNSRDERVLAVEYKGQHFYDGIDAEEKRAVGAVWASRNDRHCLFVMPTAGDFSTIADAVRYK